jgi:WD40 repeat protein
MPAGAGQATFVEHGRWDSGVGIAAFSPDGGWLVVTPEREGYPARLWDLRQPDRAFYELLAPAPRTPRVAALGFDAEGHRLITGDQDGTLRLYELPAHGARVAPDHDDLAPVRTYEGHRSGILKVALSVDGQAFASVGMDGTVRLWTPFARDEQIPTAVRTPVNADADPIVDAAYGAGGRTLFTVTVNGTARRWLTHADDLLREGRLLVGPTHGPRQGSSEVSMRRTP